MLDDFGCGPTQPYLITGSPPKGDEETIFETFMRVLNEDPPARFLIAPREIYHGYGIHNLAKRSALSAVCRSGMTEPVHEGCPVVNLDTIGALGCVNRLGDLIFVGGSLVKTGGHNMLEPAAPGKRF